MTINVILMTMRKIFILTRMQMYAQTANFFIPAFSQKKIIINFVFL